MKISLYNLLNIFHTPSIPRPSSPYLSLYTNWATRPTCSRGNKRNIRQKTIHAIYQGV